MCIVFVFVFINKYIPSHVHILGTSIVIGKKGHRVWTDGKDAKYLSKGVYNTYTAQNLRYSQVSQIFW